MRKCLAILGVVAVTAAFGAADAQAFEWHLSVYKAKQGTEEIEREYCEKRHPNDCTGYGAKCQRVSESRVDCVGASFLLSEYGEMECWSVFHWGVRRGGEIKVRFAHPHCEYVKE